MVFETERAVTALAARLDSVQVDQGHQVVDVSQADREVPPASCPSGRRRGPATP